MKKFIITLIVCIMANTSHAQEDGDSFHPVVTFTSQQYPSRFPTYRIPSSIPINKQGGHYGSNDTCVYFIDMQDISGSGLSPLRIYYKQLYKADPATFVGIAGRWRTGKDNTIPLTEDVYDYNDEKPTVKIINPKVSIENVENFLPAYGKDRNHVYSGDRLIKGADPNSFETIACGYSKDTNNVYWYDTKIDNADLETFTVVERPGRPYTHAFAYDKNYLYYLHFEKVAIDYETFEVNRDKEIYRDKNFTYTLEREIVKTKKKKKMKSEKFDIATFEANRRNNTYQFEKADGTVVRQMKYGDIFIENSTGTEAQSPPPLIPYWLEKQYYPNGKIKHKGHRMTQGSLPIGSWEYYDEQGCKTVVDEGAKYGKFSYNDVILFLDKEKLIDLSTNKGIDNLRITYDIKRHEWHVIAHPGGTYECCFDAETGEVLEYRQLKYEE